MSAFSDSDCGGEKDIGRSTTGYIVYLGSNPVAWRSSKQKSVSRSSSEAEYKALANGAAEIMWLKNLLLELHVPVTSAPTIYCDNTGATYLSCNPVFHSRMKHISLDYHFVRERVADGSLRVFMSTQRINGLTFSQNLCHEQVFFISGPSWESPMEPPS